MKLYDGYNCMHALYTNFDMHDKYIKMKRAIILAIEITRHSFSLQVTHEDPG
jgi:hypothetical protein